MAFNFRNEIKEGLILGFGFIVLNIIFGISIGFPLLAFDTFFEKYGIVSVLAPLGEELLWGSLLITIFSFLPRVTNVVLNAITFMLFHFIAYGASFEAANASFIGAAIFRILANIVITNQQGDLSQLPIPIAGIIAHSIINTYLIIKITGFVIVGL